MWLQLKPGAQQATCGTKVTKATTMVALSCSGRRRTALDKELLCGQKHGHTASGATSPASPSHLSCCGRSGSSICQGCVWTFDHTLLRLKTISALMFFRVFSTMEIQLHLIHSTTAK